MAHSEQKKVLIITYYWPPSGGAGVQRWLKLSKYLSKSGIQVHVLTVDPEKASYMQWDESLREDVEENITVYRTNTFEPLNYYAKLVGKKKVPTAGFSNVDTQNWKQKMMAAVRSRYFIPDPRKGWKKYAVAKAKEIIAKEGIKHVVTTSPPHSVQLIGLALKKEFKDQIKWISDMRDPWTDIYYYELLNHSKRSHARDLAYEKEVVETADEITTIGQLFKSSFLSKTDQISPEKIATIPNGYDQEDFEKLRTTVEQEENFTITYTGTMSDYYDPNAFFEALSDLIQKYPSEPIHFRLVGMVSDKIRAFIQEKIGDQATLMGMVDHETAIQYMLSTHVLLLITQGEKGTIPGKTFEYLAASQRIICVGKGDAADIIENCEAGRGFDRTERSAIFDYLEEAFLEAKAKKPFQSNPEKVAQFSRKAQAKAMEDVIFKS